MRLESDTENWAMFLTHNKTFKCLWFTWLLFSARTLQLHVVCLCECFFFCSFILRSFMWFTFTMWWMCEILFYVSPLFHSSTAQLLMFWFLHWTKIKWHLKIVCLFDSSLCNIIRESNKKRGRRVMKHRLQFIPTNLFIILENSAYFN